MFIRRYALSLTRRSAVLQRFLKASIGQTSCVVTRAQDSELPFLDAFVRYHVDKLGFDKIFVVYCDRRDPSFFTDEMRRRHGDKVEVLYRPDNVEKLAVCFDFYIEKFKEYDYCLGIDSDEFLVISSPTISAWLAEMSEPVIVGFPWLNISYTGGPVGDYADMVRTGVMTPRNVGKSLFKTADIVGIRPHSPIFATGYDGSAQKQKIRWLTPKRNSKKGSAAVSSLRQATGLHRASAASIEDSEKEAHLTEKPAEFCFIAHFNVRGSVDLVAKTLFQNFVGDTKGNNLTSPRLFENSDFSEVTLEDLPSRFIYAFEQKRLRPPSPDVDAALRKITIERLGHLPLDLSIQKRFLVEGLVNIGVGRNRAEEIWQSDFVERLFESLDSRFGPQFGPQPSYVTKNKRHLLERLKQLFDSQFTSHEKFKKSARKALEAAQEEVESLDLREEELTDAIIERARARLQPKLRRARGSGSGT